MRSVSKWSFVGVGLALYACSSSEISTEPSDAGYADVASTDGDRPGLNLDARDANADGGPPMVDHASLEPDGATSPQDAAVHDDASSDARDAVAVPRDGADAATNLSTADSAFNDSALEAGACERTVASYCAADASSCSNGCPCVPDWTAAQQAASWCGVRNAEPRAALYPDCGGYNLVIVAHVDTVDVYYYDLTSGNLVRIETQNGFATSCWAGPPGSSVPPGALGACLDGAAPRLLNCSALHD